jgi:acetoin utilization deacetylase AcuC-like enzyme
MHFWLRSYFLSILILPVMPLEARQASTVTLLYSDRFLQHDTGIGHPENPDRLAYLVQQLRQDKTFNSALRWPMFSAASREDLLLVHHASYLDLLEVEQHAIARHEYHTLSTGDTVISKDSLNVAKLATGAVMAGVDAVMQNESKAAFALVRPPGHHATADKGMGFCIYNHVAVAARYAQHKYAVQRVLILDIDVHHGNGTQAIFDQDDSVFYFSAHQHPLYPRSGRPTEIGHGKGKGYTINIDVPPGNDESILLSKLTEQLEPAMQRFKPELILVSAGLDAHKDDLLGGLNYSDAGYAAITQRLVDLARQYTHGKTVWVLEGGYVPENNYTAVKAILQVLVDQ